MMPAGDSVGPDTVNLFIQTYTNCIIPIPTYFILLSEKGLTLFFAILDVQNIYNFHPKIITDPVTQHCNDRPVLASSCLPMSTSPQSSASTSIGKVPSLGTRTRAPSSISSLTLISSLALSSSGLVSELCLRFKGFNMWLANLVMSTLTFSWSLAIAWAAFSGVICCRVSKCWQLSHSSGHFRSASLGAKVWILVLLQEPPCLHLSNS